MRVRSSVFLAVTLALTAQLAESGVRGQGSGEKTPPASPKPTAAVKQGAPAPASGAKAPPVPAASPKHGANSLKSVSSPSPAASPIPDAQRPAPSATVTTPKGESINITVNAAPPEPPKSNNWAAGVIGIAVLAGLGFFGWRFAQKRGLTVPDALQKMGVEMPQDGAAQGARPLRPVAPTEPPLPSLAELPVAGAAVGGVMAASVAPSAAAPYGGPPRLVGIEGPFAGETLDLDESFTIGREADNVLALTQDTTVSRRHAVVERQNSAWVVRDNESSNGTYVNGVRVGSARTLRSGDEIQIGASRLRFEGQG